MNKEKIIESFIYAEDAVPKNYGQIFTLAEFNERVRNNHCQDFMGTGYLVYNGKLVENSKEWISDDRIKIDNEYIWLDELETIIEGLEVFWYSVTELLF